MPVYTEPEASFDYLIVHALHDACTVHDPKTDCGLWVCNIIDMVLICKLTFLFQINLQILVSFKKHAKYSIFFSFFLLFDRTVQLSSPKTAQDARQRLLHCNSDVISIKWNMESTIKKI